MTDFLKEFGEYAKNQGEQWRLDNAPLMDAYQAATEAPKPRDIYLVSAMVEGPGMTGHRAHVAPFASKAEAIGSSLELWQTDKISVVSYDCVLCPGLVSIATEDPA